MKAQGGDGTKRASPNPAASPSSSTRTPLRRKIAAASRALSSAAPASVSRGHASGHGDPISREEWHAFLLSWWHAAPGTQAHGRAGLADVIEQLQGFEYPAGEWERIFAEPSAEAAFHRRERPEGQFRRVVRLPGHVASNDIKADLRDGVLTVRLPKAEEARPRKVAIQGG